MRCASRPLATLDAHAAASGVAVLDDATSTGGRSALVAEWALGKVQRVALDDPTPGQVGGTPAGTVTPFLSGNISPVGLLAQPGRAVLVGDWTTGTVYEIQAP